MARDRSRSPARLCCAVATNRTERIDIDIEIETVEVIRTDVGMVKRAKLWRKPNREERKATMRRCVGSGCVAFVWRWVGNGREARDGKRGPGSGSLVRWGPLRPALARKFFIVMYFLSLFYFFCLGPLARKGGRGETRPPSLAGEGARTEPAEALVLGR